jgi:hypothetical protein
VPGLLQTPEYTRRLLLELGTVEADTVHESVAARIERQEVLYDESKTVDAIITETALAWQPWPANVAREQIHRLRALAAQPNVRIGIVSREKQKRAPTCNSFVLTRWPDGTQDVVTESLTAEVTITDPQDVAAYAAMFTEQQKHASYADEALAVFARVEDELV